MEQKQYRHYVSMDLYGTGVAHDILLMKEDKSVGDTYFIKVEELDDVDKDRIRHILKRRNANTMPLWDLMSQVTLKNGVNALTYFHQLVKVRTASGQIINPSSARRGISPVQQIPQPPTQHNTATQQETQVSDNPPEPMEKKPQPKTRGPGRPPKNKS